jgi:iron complex transport system substrate-binding protein
LKEFSLAISKEKIADVDADVLVAYVDGIGTQKFLSDPVFSSLGAVKRGGAYALQDQQSSPG